MKYLFGRRHSGFRGLLFAVAIGGRLDQFRPAGRILQFGTTTSWKIEDGQNRSCWTLEQNNRGVKGLNSCMSPPRGHVLISISVFENQPIASGILTQPSRYNRAKSNLLADEKGLHHLNISMYIYTFNNKPLTKEQIKWLGLSCNNILQNIPLWRIIQLNLCTPSLQTFVTFTTAIASNQRIKVRLRNKELLNFKIKFYCVILILILVYNEGEYFVG